MGSCEHRTEPSGDSLEKTERILASKEGLCSTELVKVTVHVFLFELFIPIS